MRAPACLCLTESMLCITTAQMLTFNSFELWSMKPTLFLFFCVCVFAAHSLFNKDDDRRMTLITRSLADCFLELISVGSARGAWQAKRHVPMTEQHMKTSNSLNKGSSVIHPYVLET